MAPIAMPSRRKILGTAAVTVALPFLPSFGRRRARAAGCPPSPRRFLAWYTPNGFHMPDWTPTSTGKTWTMPHLLAPLEPVRSKIQVVSGLQNQRTARPGLPPGNHAGGTGCFLTQVRVHNNYNDPNRTSLDQVIAQQVGACTPLPSMQLGIEPYTSTGQCDGGPCTFARALSWTKNTPHANVLNPQVAFDRMFAGFDRGASDAEAMARRALRRSVLDHVAEEGNLFLRRLASADRRKLDEFMTGVRALETRIQAGASGTCAVPTRPPERLPVVEHTDMMIQLMALAFQCDITRVITFMLANSGTNRKHEHLGIGTGFHGLSHHQGSAASFEALRKIGRWEVELLAGFLKRLDEMKDADGKTVLDNTCVYFSSEISDGDRHNHWDLPVIVGGGLGGTLASNGQHVSYVKHTFPRPPVGPEGGRALGDLYLSFLRGFGIDMPKFGENGTAPLGEVMA